MLRMGRNVAKRITGENGKVVLIKESKLANIFGSNLATYFDLLTEASILGGPRGAAPPNIFLRGAHPLIGPPQ